VLTGKAGISKVYFSANFQDVQERFGMIPESWRLLGATSAGFEQSEKQQEEASGEEAQASQKRKSILGTTSKSTDDLRTLQKHTQELQRQETISLQHRRGKAPGLRTGAVKKQ